MLLSHRTMRSPARPAAYLLALVSVLTACGGDGTKDPTGSGTWPVVDLVDVTFAPSASATQFQVAGPAGAVVPEAEVRLSIPRTRETATFIATETGAFRGRFGNVQPGDALEVRLAYGGKVSVPAAITLPAASDAIQLSNVIARKNLDGGQVGVGGSFTTTLGRQPLFRVISTTGETRVEDGAVDAPGAFLVRLSADVGETLVVHAFDPDDLSITTPYIELVVTP